MAINKRVTLHPTDSEGKADLSTNLYPKTLKSAIINDDGSEFDVVDEEYVIDAVSGKQDELISGENIATINGQSLLEGGDIAVSTGSKVKEQIKTLPYYGKIIYNTEGKVDDSHYDNEEHEIHDIDNVTLNNMTVTEVLDTPLIGYRFDFENNNYWWAVNHGKHFGRKSAYLCRNNKNTDFIEPKYDNIRNFRKRYIKEINSTPTYRDLLNMLFDFSKVELEGNFVDAYIDTEESQSIKVGKNYDFNSKQEQGKCGKKLYFELVLKVHPGEDYENLIDCSNIHFCRSRGSIVERIYEPSWGNRKRQLAGDAKVMIVKNVHCDETDHHIQYTCQDVLAYFNITKIYFDLEYNLLKITFCNKVDQNTDNNIDIE